MTAHLHHVNIKIQGKIFILLYYIVARDGRKRVAGSSSGIRRVDIVGATPTLTTIFQQLKKTY